MKTCICVQIKNENLYLLEFVEYYYKLGFSKMYIYDNNDYEFPNLIIQKYIDNGFVEIINILDKYKQALTEIKEVAEKSCCLQPTSVCEEYENCKECSRTSDDETVKQILQKISECEVKNAR